MIDLNSPSFWDVAVIGAGPSGISAAVELKKKGVQKVVVIDRESEAGGIPRHCGHYSFGLIEYARPMGGPAYAKKLALTALDHKVVLALNTSVTAIGPGGRISAVDPRGAKEIRAKRVILATGARETPRSARLVSGGRMMGITTTGALQSMVYLNKQIPFRTPVIVGSEMVSLSALLTCKKAGIKPVAMIEQEPCPQVPWPLGHAPRYFGIPFYTGSRITEISGKTRVSRVRLTLDSGRSLEIPCDGVVFTGMFTPESTLVRTGHLEMDKTSGSPLTDRFGRCSDPAFYAVGNLLPPLNMAMNCWRAGRKTARTIIQDLNGEISG